jgi:MtN3 and saliva related transmembrane protein
MGYGSISMLDVVACLGSCTAVLSLVPQIIHSYKTKSVDDISILMLLNLTVSSISWTIYGIMIHDMPVFWTNVLLGLGSCIMLAFKKQYRSKR